jgi:NitT/TauT family transport system substrate-binding protein
VQPQSSGCATDANDIAPVRRKTRDMLGHGIRLRTLAVLVSLVAAGPLASGCGGDAAGGIESENGRAKLTVQVIPIHEVAPVYLGIKKGFFAAENLELEVKTGQGGADSVPPVISGDVQVAYSNTPSLFAAAVRGLPIEIVAPAGGGPLEKEHNALGAVMVERDSAIRGYADLEGRTVAVNTLGNVLDVSLNAAVEQTGVDHTQVEYLEVPFPDMLAALDSGRVDAAFLAPPFETIARRSGAYRAIGFPLVEVRPEFVFAGYYVSRPWAEENQEVLERFLRALRRSMIYAAEHEQQTRATIGEFTKLPKDLIPVIPIGSRRPDCEELAASSEVLAGLMVRYGVLEREPDLQALIRPGFCEG